MIPTWPSSRHLGPSWVQLAANLAHLRPDFVTNLYQIASKASASSVRYNNLRHRVPHEVKSMQKRDSEQEKTMQHDHTNWKWTLIGVND